MKKEQAGKVLILLQEERETKVLKLTLKKESFDVMVTGEKPFEFRKNSDWIASRLKDSKTGKDKHYDLIEFTNGYGKDKPRFICEFKGYFMTMLDFEMEYSNGLKVEVEVNDVVICLGDIINKINI